MSVLWLMKIQCGACSDSSGAATGGRCPSSCSAFDFDFDLDLDLCAPLNHAGRSEGTPSLGEVPSGGAKAFWLLLTGPAPGSSKVPRRQSGTLSGRHRRNGYVLDRLRAPYLPITEAPHPSSFIRTKHTYTASTTASSSPISGAYSPSPNSPASNPDELKSRACPCAIRNC